MNFVIPPSSLSSGSSVKIGNFPLNLISPCRPLSVESTNVQAVESFTATVGELASGKYPVSVLANDSLGSKVTTYNGEVSFMVTPSCKSNVRISGSRTGKVSAKKGAFSLSIPRPTLPFGTSSFAIKLSDPQNAVAHCELVSVSSPEADPFDNWQIFHYQADSNFLFDGNVVGGVPQGATFGFQGFNYLGRYRGKVVFLKYNYEAGAQELGFLNSDKSITMISLPTPVSNNLTEVNFSYSDGTDLFISIGSYGAYCILKYSLNGTVSLSENLPYAAGHISKKAGSSSEIILTGIDLVTSSSIHYGTIQKADPEVISWGTDSSIQVQNWNAVKVGGLIYSATQEYEDGGSFKSHNPETGITNVIYSYPEGYELVSRVVKGANNKIGFLLEKLDSDYTLKFVVYSPTTSSIATHKIPYYLAGHTDLSDVISVDSLGGFILSVTHQSFDGHTNSGTQIASDVLDVTRLTNAYLIEF